MDTRYTVEVLADDDNSRVVMRIKGDDGSAGLFSLTAAQASHVALMLTEGIRRIREIGTR